MNGRKAKAIRKKWRAVVSAQLQMGRLKELRLQRELYQTIKRRVKAMLLPIAMIPKLQVRVS